MRLFNDIYSGRKTFLTGHTGFKGSWLLAWLEQLGAEICGYSLTGQVSYPDHASLLSTNIQNVRGDICDYQTLLGSLKQFRPEIVFHLAAQPLVHLSYKEPLETFAANVMGTANLLQACRECDSVRAVVVVTTDKVYQNREWDWGYRETDTLGGHDPYAASKACSELVAACFRQSFFESERISEDGNCRILMAIARAGNVIGGGDWALDRIVPDIVRDAAEGKTTTIRMPHAVRPWEHVLEPLAAYLLLGQGLLEGRQEFAQAWNFGPEQESIVTVGELAKLAQVHWDKLKFDLQQPQSMALHETNYLALDCSKAKRHLGWKPIWPLEETTKHTMAWYRGYYENNEVLTNRQLSQYIQDAVNQQAVWTQ